MPYKNLGCGLVVCSKRRSGKEVYSFEFPHHVYLVRVCSRWDEFCFDLLSMSLFSLSLSLSFSPRLSVAGEPKNTEGRGNRYPDGTIRSTTTPYLLKKSRLGLGLFLFTFAILRNDLVLLEMGGKEAWVGLVGGSSV